MSDKTGLVDILEQDKIITSEQASQVKLEQVSTGTDASEILVQRRLATPLELIKARAKLLKIPYLDLTQKGVSLAVLSKIPESVARHYILVPVEVKDEGLVVAMKDPLDLQVLEFLETKTGMKILPVLASEEAILRSIDEHYSAGMEKEVAAALRETETEVIKAEKEIDTLKKAQELIESAPVARIVSTVLEYAVKSRASDIHIEPQENYTRIRYRIDGVLRERLSLPRVVNDAVVSRIKILSNLKIDEKRLPQDGRFNIKMEGVEVDLRVSSLPTSYGEKMVLRLLRKEEKVATLMDLGLTGRALKNFEESLKKTRGIILITGPTGSGKTTTLRTALQMVNNPGVNIVTLEDPVEYVIPGVNQVQISSTIGLTFASGLRSILRQDPNIIMVGEIRDRETMELAVQASLTGHLVFSTLHTNSAAGSLPRLLDMGAEPFLLVSTMELVMAQRLVRTLCEACKEKYEAPPEILIKLKEGLGDFFPVKKTPIFIYKNTGCEKCLQVGFVGRVGIYEILPVSEKIARLILTRAAADAIEKQAVDEGMIKMIQDGFLKVLAGVTTIEEVLRVAQE